MTKLHFCGYVPHENGMMALVKTAEMEIPMHICIDNYPDYPDLEPCDCHINICGVGYDFDVYADQAAYDASGEVLASVGMIPMGTFALEGDTDFRPNPSISFSGIVEDVLVNPNPSKNSPNYDVLVKSLDFTMEYYIRYDGEIKPGNIINGVAFLFGDIIPDEEA